MVKKKVYLKNINYPVENKKVKKIDHIKNITEKHVDYE